MENSIKISEFYISIVKCNMTCLYNTLVTRLIKLLLIPLCFLVFTHNVYSQIQQADNSYRLPDISIDEKKLSHKNKIWVKRINLRGNTQFSVKELTPIILPYENRENSIEELHELAQKISLHYVENGYINSGVIVPDQTINDGTIELQVIEGKLSDIRLKGLKRLNEQYIRTRLKIPKTSAFNVNTLQKNLKILNRNPRIGRLDAEIKPGLERGEAVLDINIEENKNYNLSLSANNTVSPNVGGSQGELEFQHLNLLGLGDTLRFLYGRAEGLDTLKFDYSLPINSQDTTVALHYEGSDSEVVTEAFESLNITGDTEKYSISLRHPIVQTLNTDQTIGISLSERDSRSYLLGEPFSFSPGVNQGRSNATIATFFHEFINRGELDILAWYFSIEAGLSDQDQTIQGTDPKIPTGKFRGLFTQAQWLRRINLWSSTFSLRGALRLVDEPLLIPEQFSLGGVDSVRGYRESLYTRDNGALLSVGLRIPLIQPETKNDHSFQMTPFIDYGAGWNDEEASKTREELSSIGIAFNWQRGQQVDIQLSLANALEDDIPQQAEYDLQDDGIHFTIKVNFFNE